MNDRFNGGVSLTHPNAHGTHNFSAVEIGEMHPGNSRALKYTYVELNRSHMLLVDVKLPTRAPCTIDTHFSYY